jgi:CxxC-x17-CxxC domain-containing protein
MILTDELLTCSDCGQQFTFTVGEQQFFREKQFSNKPRRCKPCKQKQAGRSSKPISQTPVICADCGEPTTVPFVPRANRPVLCRACFQGARAQHV